MEHIEKERIEKINTAAATHLHDYLLRLDNEEINGDDLLAVVYAGLITSKLMGYSPQALVNDALLGAEKFEKVMLEMEEETDES